MIRAGRGARFPAALPEPATPAETAMLDLAGLAAFLSVSRATAERLVGRSDIPKLDVSPPGARRRHLWRFNRDQVLAWARGRGQRNGGAA